MFFLLTIDFFLNLILLCIRIIVLNNYFLSILWNILLLNLFDFLDNFLNYSLFLFNMLLILFLIHRIFPHILNLFFTKLNIFNLMVFLTQIMLLNHHVMNLLSLMSLTTLLLTFLLFLLILSLDLFLLNYLDFFFLIFFLFLSFLRINRCLFWFLSENIQFHNVLISIFWLLSSSKLFPKFYNSIRVINF